MVFSAVLTRGAPPHDICKWTRYHNQSGAAAETRATSVQLHRNDRLTERDDGGRDVRRGAVQDLVRKRMKRMMKVHRKILTHFLSCPSPIDKDGYLYKKRERTGVFRRRWFVLKGNLLFYQDRPADRHIQGAIVLEGCEVRTEDSDLDFSLVFRGLRTYRFCAGDRCGQEEWVKSLLTASHRYMSLLLRDLGMQYQEAKHLRRCGASNSPDLFTMSSDLVLPVPRSSASGNLTLIPHASPATPSSSSSSSSAVALRPMPRKSPKVWARRNAHVTPIRGPAPASSEWPRVDFDPLHEFSKIHEFYGREVKRVRDNWVKCRERGEGEEPEERDLIDLF